MNYFIFEIKHDYDLIFDNEDNIFYQRHQNNPDWNTHLHIATFNSTEPAELSLITSYLNKIQGFTHVILQRPDILLKNTEETIWKYICDKYDLFKGITSTNIKLFGDIGKLSRNLSFFDKSIILILE